MRPLVEMGQPQGLSGGAGDPKSMGASLTQVGEGRLAARTTAVGCLYLRYGPESLFNTHTHVRMRAHVHV